MLQYFMMFKDRFKLLVKERGTTQETIADLLGIHRVTISKWMSTGLMPRADQLSKIAEHLGVSVDYLVSGTLGNFPMETGGRNYPAKTEATLKQMETWIDENGDLLHDLMSLSPEQLSMIKTMVEAAAKSQKKKI